jgi:tetratricopeptide (TPR) repeat protein
MAPYSLAKRQKMDHNKRKELREKLETLLKALEEIENMPDKDYEKEKIYKAIGLTYGRLGESEKSVEYLKKASEIIKKYNDLRAEIMGMIVESYTLRKSGEYDEAETTLYRAIRKISQMRQSNSSDDNKEFANTLEVIARIMLSFICEEKQLRKISNYQTF